MITKTIDLFQLIPERERVKDAYSPQKDQKVSKFGQFFLRDEVKIFKLNFLSSLLPKWENLGAYQIENLSKHPLLLILVSIRLELKLIQTGGEFCSGRLHEVNSQKLSFHFLMG